MKIHKTRKKKPQRSSCIFEEVILPVQCFLSTSFIKSELMHLLEMSGSKGYMQDMYIHVLEEVG